VIKVYETTDAYGLISKLSTVNETGDGAVSEHKKIEKSVAEIIDLVKRKGDNGIVEIAKKLGDTIPSSLRLPVSAIESALAGTSEATTKTLEIAASRIRNFGQAIVDNIKAVTVDCGEFQTGIDYKPVRRVACYVPAGRYPLPSTALMTAITAQVAGVEEIVIISPQLKNEIIAAGTIAGVTEFYQIGGAQAVAAMTFGTDSIKPVDMIVGPGNAYVTEAKRQLQGTIGIDMLAGPSEICVIADETANPEWLSLDLLSQAEHDPDARAYLLTTSIDLAKRVAELVEQDVRKLGLPDFLSQSLGSSAIFVLNTIADCCAAANQIAPEHLLLAVRDPDAIKSNLTSYGALFMGHGCTVAFGDYMAGPNHTLPTNRSAKFQGCLSPLTFLRPQSWIRVKTKAPALASETADFANIEGLTAHAAAASARS
jgi:histidinol dehydrogenase